MNSAVCGLSFVHLWSQGTVDQSVSCQFWHLGLPYHGFSIVATRHRSGLTELTMYACTAASIAIIVTTTMALLRPKANFHVVYYFGLAIQQYADFCRDCTGVTVVFFVSA